MSRRIKKLNFDTICRTCLSERNDMKIFSTHLVEMIMTCTPLKVEENDGLPTRVCITCYKQLSRFCAFRSKVEKNDFHLRNLLNEQTLKADKSIIEQAASNADIDMSGDIYKNEEQFSEDDNIKLSRVKVNSSRLRLAKIRANELIDNAMEEENESDELFDEVYNVKNSMKLDNSLTHKIFTDGPPPLVPLIPIAPEDIPDFPSDNIIVDEALKPISNETPPLIPIKPLPTIDPATLMSTLEPTIQQIIKFSCNACTEDFTDPIALKHHLASLHSNTSNLICNICKKEFFDRKRLIGHLKGHMIVKHYACKLCGKRYPNPSTFKVHMRTHTGERPFKCQICNKGFIRWAGVVGHMRSHTENKPFKCTECGKGFKIQSNLERHKILHTGMMPFCCSYCGKTFSQSDNLLLHVRTYHTHERPYLCSQCGKGFVSSTRLNRHMWVHSGHKPFNCKSCSKSYTNSNDLKNHERTHNGGLREADKPYACMACDMRFFHPCRLAKHMKTHERPYGCLECLKTFSREDVLQKHIISKHSNVEQQIQVQHHEEHIYTLGNF